MRLVTQHMPYWSNKPKGLYQRGPDLDVLPTLVGIFPLGSLARILSLGTFPGYLRLRHFDVGTSI